MKVHAILFLAVALAFASVQRSEAGRPLSDYEFALRFAAATSRFATYADVAALGGAQAGSEWSSSLNPAAVAWPQPGRRYTRALSGQYANVQFAEGSQLDVFAEALTFDAGGWGVFLPAAAQVRGNHATRRDGLGFEFEADFFQLQWGKLVSRHATIGATVGITTSDTRLDAQGVEVAQTRSETYTFRFGVVLRPLEKLRVGAVVEYAATPARNRQLERVPPFYIPTWVHTRDTTHQVLLRTGLTWEYAQGCDLYVDYHGGVFADDSGELWVHRFPIGIEQQIIPDILFARVGATIDTRGNTAFTAGLGVVFGPRASLDLAWQSQVFPEIRPEFGAAETFGCSIAVGF